MSRGSNAARFDGLVALGQSISTSPHWVKQILVVQGVFIALNAILTVLGACNGSFAFSGTAFTLMTFHFLVFAVSHHAPKLDANAALARYYNKNVFPSLELLKDPPFFPHNFSQALFSLGLPAYGLPPYRYMLVQYPAFDTALLFLGAIISMIVVPTLQFYLFAFIFAICMFAILFLSLYWVRVGQYGSFVIWLAIMACFVMPLAFNWFSNLAQYPIVTSSIVLCNCNASIKGEQVFGRVPAQCLVPAVTMWTLKSDYYTFRENPFGIANISIDSTQQLVAAIDVNNTARCETANGDSLYVKLTCDRVGRSVLFSERTNVYFNPDNIACFKNESSVLTNTSSSTSSALSVLDGIDKDSSEQAWWPFMFVLVMFSIIAIAFVVGYVRALQIALLKHKLLFAEQQNEQDEQQTEQGEQ